MRLKLKNLWVQMGIIVILSIVVSMVYNQFLEAPLPVLKTFDPGSTRQGNEDLSAYYSEIDSEGLKAMVEGNVAVLLDARTRENYLESHIPGAMSFPIGEFSRDYDKISPFLEADKVIIIYCIGVHCIDSVLLAKELYQKGHRQIYVYREGIEEWQELGFPIEAGGGNHE